MRAKKIFATLVSSLLILNHVGITTAFAEVALPNGTVKGLPEKLDFRAVRQVVPLLSAALSAFLLYLRVRFQERLDLKLLASME